MKLRHWKAFTFSSFAVGCVGLGLTAPGYLIDYQIYCSPNGMLEQILNQACALKIVRPGTRLSKQYQPYGFVAGSTLSKSIGIISGTVAFVIAAYSSQKTAEMMEELETLEAIDLIASISFHKRKRILQNEIAEKGVKLELSMDYRDYLESLLPSDDLDAAYYRTMSGFDEPSTPEIPVSSLKPPQDEDYSVLDGTVSDFRNAEPTYTKFGIERNEAINEIKRLQDAGHNQSTIIFILWGAKPGGTQVYRDALAQYKELTVEGNEI